MLRMKSEFDLDLQLGEAILSRNQSTNAHHLHPRLQPESRPGDPYSGNEARNRRPFCDVHVKSSFAWFVSKWRIRCTISVINYVID